MLIDTHAHLFWDSYKKDFDQVIQNCIDACVKTIINVGTEVKTSKEAFLLESGNGEMTFYSSIGIHPHKAQKYKDPKILNEDINKLEEIYNQNPKKVIAIGECGLDYFFKSNPGFVPSQKENEQLIYLQKKLFTSQINLAKKLNLPLLIHCRDDRSSNPENSQAWNEVLELTRDHFGIFHCYSGLPETTIQIPETKFLVSFAANITYPKNDYLIEAIKTLPLEKIVLETDSPFLAPQKIRGQRNDPSYVSEVAKTIAEIKRIPLEEVANQTTKNAKKLFSLSD